MIKRTSVSKLATAMLAKPSFRWTRLGLLIPPLDDRLATPHFRDVLLVRLPSTSKLALAVMKDSTKLTSSVAYTACPGLISLIDMINRDFREKKKRSCLVYPGFPFFFQA